MNNEAKEKRRQYRINNREKILARQRERNQKPEVKKKIRESCMLYRIKNRDKLIVQRREYYQRPETKERTRQYRIKNREKILAQRRKHYQIPRVKKQYGRYAQEIRNTILKAYGNKCECCGETIKEFLTIDHINRDGAEHRQQFHGSISIYRDIIKQGCPRDKYRLLCMNCNFAIKWGKPCPHEVRRMKAKIIMIQSR